MYARPDTLDEALDRVADGARVLAGATDIFPTAGERPLQGAFVDVAGIGELRGISSGRDEIRIGGAVTWKQIARADLPPAFDALKAAAREIGAIQIQTRATIAGNLCNASPAADGVPPLLVLDAEVELASRRGRRRLPLAEFLTGPRRTELARDEILTTVICPLPSPALRSAFLKLGARRYLVISIAMVAVALDIAEGVVSEARIAVGACSATAMRLKAAERRLSGLPAAGLCEALHPQDFSAISPIDDLRATGVYRREAALTLTRRALQACLSGHAGGAL